MSLAIWRLAGGQWYKAITARTGWSIDFVIPDRAGRSYALSLCDRDGARFVGQFDSADEAKAYTNTRELYAL